MAVSSRKIRRAGDKAAQVIGLNDPTPERQRRDTFAVIPAPRMSDEQIGRDKIVKTRKQACRINRLEREGTLTRDQANALLRYESLVERAGYDRGRSCLNIEVRGSALGGAEGAMDIRAMARQRLARARNAVDDPAALMFVDAVLWPVDGANFVGCADRMLRSAGATAARRELARTLVRKVADALLECFRA